MKKKLSGQCPCGYFFGIFDDVRDAIVNVRFHFDFYHKDFLPFGITNKEVLSLLKKGRPHRKQKVTLSNLC